MIITRLIGGLGNQLFQYAVARKISIENRIPVKLDLSCLGQSDGRTFKLRYYNIKAEVATAEEIRKHTWHHDSDTIVARAYRKIEKRLYPRHRRKYFVENYYFQYEAALLKVRGSTLIEGFWQHHRYLENPPAELLTELTLRVAYLNDTPPLFHEISGNENSVSIHVRRGDYVSDPNNLGWFGMMPLTYYKKAAEIISEKVKAPHFYIFSDDPAWTKANLHINAPVTYVDIDSGTKDYLELEAMSRCRHNVSANSTFSWWAAFLNRNPEKIVIAPAQWVVAAELKDRVSIQMPGWIKI